MIFPRASVTYHALCINRFDISGVHPQSRMPGTYTQVPYCKKATSELVGHGAACMGAVTCYGWCQVTALVVDKEYLHMHEFTVLRICLYKIPVHFCASVHVCHIFKVVSF